MHHIINNSLDRGFHVRFTNESGISKLLYYAAKNISQPRNGNYPTMQRLNTHWDNPAPFTKILSPAEKDIDGLNHTNNAVYVQWCEEVAWAHSASLGMDLDAYKQLNRAMAIRHADYDYLLPSNLGDQLLIGTWLTDSDGQISLERRFQIVRPNDGATILRGRWSLVCIEMSSGRPRRMPPEFCDAYLGALTNTSNRTVIS